MLNPQTPISAHAAGEAGRKLTDAAMYLRTHYGYLSGRDATGKPGFTVWSEEALKDIVSACAMLGLVVTAKPDEEAAAILAEGR